MLGAALLVVAVLALGATISVAQGTPRPLEQAAGLVSVVAAGGAIYLLGNSERMRDVEKRLADLGSFITAERAAEILQHMHRQDRADQLTLIILSAVGSAIQPFAGGIVRMLSFAWTQISG